MPYEITSNFTYLSSFVCFTAHLHHRFRELANLRYSPPSSLCSSLNKGLTYLKIDSQKTRILNLALIFMILSFPQLLRNPADWRYLVFLTICIIFSLIYFYTFYQLVKEVNQKPLI